MEKSSRARSRIIAYAVVGVAIVLFLHLTGGANGTEGGFVEHPVLRLTGLIAWGAFVGAAIGWLASATSTRAALPLGLATIAAAIGFIAGLWYAADVLGESILDGKERVQLLSALVGGGTGWAIGASIGFALPNPAPRPSRRDARRTRGVALAAMLIGVLAAWWAWTGERSRHLHPHGAGARIPWATLVDAALVAVTLLVVAGIRPRGDDEPPEREAIHRLASGIGRVGMGLGCFVLIAVLAGAPQARTSSETPQQINANYRTLGSVSEAARRYMEERTEVPPDLGSLRPFGAVQNPGTVIASFEPLEDGVCVLVGTDHEGVAVEPFVSGKAYLPRSDGSLSESAGVGIIPACRGVLSQLSQLRQRRRLAPESLSRPSEPALGYVKGNRACHHYGSSSTSIAVTHFTHQYLRRPGD